MPPPTTLRAWRVLVAVSGASGVALAAARYDVWWTALSQLTSLAVAVGYLALSVRARPGTRADDVLRGGLACVAVLVAVGFWAMPQTPGLGRAAYSLLEHGVTPALVLLDVVVVTRLSALRRRDAVWWTVGPLAYLGWYVVGDLGTYPALDPGRPGVLLGQVCLLGALVLATGAALVRLAGPPSSAPQSTPQRRWVRLRFQR